MSQSKQKQPYEKSYFEGVQVFEYSNKASAEMVKASFEKVYQEFTGENETLFHQGSRDRSNELRPNYDWAVDLLEQSEAVFSSDFHRRRQKIEDIVHRKLEEKLK